MAKRSCAGIQDISNLFRPKTKSVKLSETSSEGLLNHDSDSDIFVEVNINYCLMEHFTYLHLTIVLYKCYFVFCLFQISYLF
jgi:hypothetical protein